MTSHEKTAVDLVSHLTIIHTHSLLSPVAEITAALDRARRDALEEAANIENLLQEQREEIRDLVDTEASDAEQE